MIRNLASVSTQGNATEGFFLLIGIAVVLIGIGSKKVRSGVRSSARAVRRVGNKEVGRKPKSRIGQILIGKSGRSDH